MKELLQSSLAKGALHHTSFDEEEEEEEDDDHTEVDADYTVLTPPERTALPSERDDAARSCRPEAAVGVHLSKPSPNSSSSATIDQLIAMQLLATLQTQQLQQGSTGVQFGLGSSPWRRGQPNDCGVESDDDFPISEASSSLGGSRGRDYTLVDLDKEIDVSPRKPRGHGLPPSGAPSNSVPARNNCGGTPTNDTDKTTVMLRNIPNKYTQRILLNSIDGRGFEGTYDFFYLPIDFRNRCNLGYALINFTTNESAVAFTHSFNGYALPAFKSTKVCEVCWARVQGLEANVEHYRNSPVNEMPHNEYKPMLFAQGHPVEFPRPLSAADSGDQKLVVHQTPQHTGGGILQPPPSQVNPQQDTVGNSSSSGAAVIRRNKIFIGGLSVTSTSEAIRQHFQQWGRVTEAAVITDKKTGQSRGFGFCTYAHDVPDEVLTAEHWVDGRNIGVRIYASGPPTQTSAVTRVVQPDLGLPQEVVAAGGPLQSGSVRRDYLSLLAPHAPSLSPTSF
ncbi:hypothetical protein FOZ62_026703 [Perkinsus olseni]|uniref:RRM domain-containing protein n=1 Tax=Perkinsus olseni TaxID=32597 RepID=A0A7J6QX25_PEROL|nr:hypothetical protein FOZ62_026703 [Perkinsus olseni]